ASDRLPGRGGWSRVRDAACHLSGALDHVREKLVLDGGDVHKHHADPMTSIPSEAEASHVGPQRDTAGCLLVVAKLQEDEATPRRMGVLWELEGRAVK